MTVLAWPAALQGPTIAPIDLTELVAVFMGISVVLVPIIGLTARFALKPTVEALGRLFEGRGRDEALQLLERRLGLMEHQMEAMEHSLRSLAEVREFDRSLASGHPVAGAGPEANPE
ncbi:MAG: hypothetical protein D6701_12140 [Gemmatimonadetes bacterium]|nr:MAG: hypothetical protein D6701_12140 [Gemmatimonadota bacterium]